MANDRVYWKKAVLIPVTATALSLAMRLFYVTLSRYCFIANTQNIDTDIAIDSSQLYGNVSSNRYS